MFVLEETHPRTGESAWEMDVEEEPPDRKEGENERKVQEPEEARIGKKDSVMKMM
jgi:hypothetical protein